MTSWQRRNLEHDLQHSELIVSNCKSSEQYCKELYAALCNMRWLYIEPWHILNDYYWHCSWRYAGGIIADIIGEGDYIDWYCSGNEGYVSDQIADHLLTLNWKPIPYDD